MVNDHRTDDEVFEQMRLLIADHGAQWTEGYLDFLADNRTFTPYWADGVDAIRDNTVQTLVFGRECMIKVGRKFDLGSLNEGQIGEIFQNLAIEMDRMVLEMVKGKVAS